MSLEEPVITATAAAEEPSEPEPEASTEPGYDFDAAFQLKIAALLISDSTFVARVDGLIDPSHFENDGLGAVVRVLNDYVSVYKTAPGRSLLPMLLRDAFAAKRIRSDIKIEVQEQARALIKVDLSGRDFVVDKVAEFARKRALEKAIIASVDLLERGEYDKINKLIRSASDIGSETESGEYDFWAEIESRTEGRVAMAAGTAKPTGITTGYKELDALLYNKGWGRKELTLLMGAAKRGKSMGLGEFAISASLAGYNAIYFTCEVGTRILADRFDANLTDTAMKEVGLKPHAIKAALLAKRAGAGHLKIREFASGSLKCSQIRRILERYRSEGIIFDLIVVDYADIMAPERQHNEERDDSKEIFIGLRAIGFEEDAAMLSATQTNRIGAKSMVAKDTDVADDYNKVRTADLTISINASPEELDAGEARLYFAAARNDAGNIQLRVKQDRAKMKFITKVLGLVVS